MTHGLEKVHAPLTFMIQSLIHHPRNVILRYFMVVLPARGNKAS